MTSMSTTAPQNEPGIKAIMMPAAILFGIVVIGAVASHVAGPDIHKLLYACRSDGMIGMLLLWLATVVVAMIGFVPASIMGAASGLIYGDLTGFILSATAIMAGATMALLVARIGLRDKVKKLAGKYGQLDRFDRAVTREGWKFVGLVRLSPVMPFSVASYILAMTGVTVKDYMIGTIASLPALFLYVMAGSAGSSAPGPLRIIMLFIGGAATIWLGWKSSKMMSAN